jgi:diacylglycerol kinase (ATP)
MTGGVTDGTLFLMNPKAGSGRAGQVWDGLRAALPAHPRAIRAITAADPAAADRELAQALADGSPERLIVVGGDGSVHLAVNTLFRMGVQDRVSLGLVPAGTGSDLARTLGLPREPRAALERALTAPPSPLDALAVLMDGREPHWALNVASAGISGLVDEMVNAQPVRGTTAFLTATLKALGRYQPFTARVELDGELWYQGGVFLLAIANGRFFGKGMRVAPRAEVDDGLADVVLVRPMPRWQIPLRMPRIYLGTHLDQPNVAWRRARRIRLEPEGPFPPFDVDGELLPSGAATFELLPGVLRFIR